MKAPFVTIGLIALLAGCAEHNPCDQIQLHTYSPAAEERLTKELTWAPATAEWPEAILDYRHLRDSVKACRSRK